MLVARGFGVGLVVMLLVGAMAAPAVTAGQGAHVWTRQFGTPKEDRVYGVAVYAAGVHAGGRTFGSPQGVYKRSRDGFVRKYGTG